MIIKIICLTLISFVSCKLEQVVSFFRHGARYHTNDHYDGNDTLLYWGQLTSVGMRQHQNLGKTLRKEYIQNLNFLSNHYNESQIEIYSTHFNRTIQSAMSQIFGLYPSGTGPKLIEVKPQYYIPPFTNNSNVQQSIFALPAGHQPIPIKFNSKIIMEECKNQQAQMKKNIVYQQSQYDDIKITYTPFLNKIADIFNISKNQMNFDKLNEIYDTLTVDQYLGKPLPPQLSINDLINMRHIHYWNLALTHSFNLSKAINSYRFQRILSNFDQRIKNPSYPLKWTFLSLHDGDLYCAQSDLNITSSLCIQQLYRTGKTQALNCQPGPQFAASIIFELHSQNNNQYYVKIRYNGKYMNLCQKTQEKCSYDEWKARIKKYILVDVQGFCGNNKPFK